jgi:hypothetical protein
LLYNIFIRTDPFSRGVGRIIHRFTILIVVMTF